MYSSFRKVFPVRVLHSKSLKKLEVLVTLFLDITRRMMGRKSEALCVVGGPRPNPDCPKSARMASYMQAACSLAVKQNGNLILDLNISTVIPHQSPK